MRDDRFKDDRFFMKLPEHDQIQKEDYIQIHFETGFISEPYIFVKKDDMNRILVVKTLADGLLKEIDMIDIVTVTRYQPSISISIATERLSTDEYYLQIAEAAAKRSICDRAKVGCVLVYDGHILDTGYNGSLPGYDHCDQKTCYYEGKCIRTTHAEINALQRAIKMGHTVNGATLYSSHRPCYSCLTTLAAFDIKDIVFREIYEDPKAEAYAKLVNLRITQIKKPN